jgi:DNA-binding transcriptional ArsR family regulator
MADAIAERFRLFSEPTRLRLLDLLADGERSVGDLAGSLGCTQANVSKHLALLADAGVVGRRRDGLHSYYAVTDRAVYELCGQVCDTLRRHADERAASLREPA